MKHGKAEHRVLIVSGNDKIYGFLESMLNPEEFTPVKRVKTAGEAKRLLIDMAFDIVIINTPLSDDYGIELASDIIGGTMGVMLLVNSDRYEPVSYQLEDLGILTVPKPNSEQGIYSAIRLLVATNERLKKLESKNRSLQEKMNDIRTVNRAKWLLIENLGMAEKEAHYYIEKQAMDMQFSRREVAEDIIRTYDK